MLRIGDYLIVLALVLVALIIVVALFRGDPMLTTLQFALVLTVAAIPVAILSAETREEAERLIAASPFASSVRLHEASAM